MSKATTSHSTKHVMAPCFDTRQFTKMNALKRQKEESSLAFTLIEVVISISLLAIIVVVAYSALTQIMRSKRLLDDSRDTYLVAQAVLKRFSRELQLVTVDKDGRGTIPDSDEPSDPTGPVLLGERKNPLNDQRGDSITFIAIEAGQYLPDGGTHTGLVQVQYHVEKDPDSPSGNPNLLLIREEFPYIFPYSEAHKKRMTFPITDKISDLQFSYFDSEREQWVDTWGQAQAQRNKLPALIRFSVSLISAQGKIETFSSALPIRGVN